jgi:signal transduction histidine kinase
MVGEHDSPSETAHDGDSSEEDEAGLASRGRHSDVSASQRGVLARVESTFRLLTPEFIRRQYLLKFAVGLLAVVVLISTVGGAAYLETSNILDERVEADVKNDAERGAEELAEWRTQRSRWVRLLSEARAFQSEIGIVISNYLQTEIKNIPEDVYRLHYVNMSSNTIVASSNTQYEGRDLGATNATWVHRDLSFTNSDDTVVSSVYRTGSDPVVAFVSPVPQTSDAVLVAVVDAQSVVAEFESGIPGSFTQVVTTNGTVVMDQRGPGSVLSPYADTASQRDSADTETGAVVDTATAKEVPILDAAETGTVFRKQSMKSRSLGSSYVVAATPVAGTDWIVLTHAPTREAYLVRSEITTHLLQILSVSLVGLGLLAFTLGRGTVRSLERLTRKAERLEAGALDVDLDSERVDEIGELYESFSEMRDALGDRIRESENARAAAQEAKSELQQRNQEVEEQRAIISVLNRVLRHNVRNGANVMLGHLDFLGSDDPPQGREYHRRQVETKVHDLLDKAEKARYIEELVDDDTRDLYPLDLSDRLATEAAHLQDRYPNVTVETEIEPSVLVEADNTVEFVFENLLENAVEHNTAGSPEVFVSLERDAEDGREDNGDDWIVARIADNGPGIPEEEVEVLEERYETAIHHASGIGLWITNWLVTEMNGELDFHERDPTGTVVTIRFRAVSDASA